MRGARWWTLLAAAVLAGCTADLEGMSPDVALKAGAVRDDVDLVRAALEEGADANAVLAGATALNVAALLDHGEVARILLEAGADPDLRQHNGDSPAQLAAQSGGSDALAALSEGGADLGAIGGAQFGMGAVHYAAVTGNIAALDVLEQAGVDIMAPNGDGWIAPHQAMCAGQIEAFDWFRARDDFDPTRGLICARDMGRQDMVDHLESLG